MSITPKTYERKPFTVQAIQVTPQNMREVAEWCGGVIVPGERAGKKQDCIQVDVKNALNEKQKYAFANDWVLKGTNGKKVYTSRAFNGCFAEVQKLDPTKQSEKEIWVQDQLVQECEIEGNTAAVR